MVLLQKIKSYISFDNSGDFDITFALVFALARTSIVTQGHIQFET